MKTRKLFITGGTSKIGQAIIHLGLEKGYEILTTTSQDVQAFPIKSKLLKVIGCDFSTFNPVHEAFLDEIEKQCDALILNACTRLPDYQVLDEQDFRTLTDFIDQNTKPNLRILQKALTSMKRNQYGRIVFLSSMAAEMGLSKYAPYIVAKTAIEGVIKNIAVDYGKFNIQANTLRPGIISTERTEHLLSDERYAKRAEKIIPSGKIGEPEQIAKAALFLIEPDSYINGETIHVSGGLPLVSSLFRL